MNGGSANGGGGGGGGGGGDAGMGGMGMGMGMGLGMGMGGGVGRAANVIPAPAAAGRSGTVAYAVLTAAVAAFMLYWAHRVLQLQYHRHCKADLIRVVLFNQSVMCSHIAGILNLVELACNQAVKHLTAHVLGTLNVVAGGALLGGGLGLFQLPQALFA